MPIDTKPTQPFIDYIDDRRVLHAAKSILTRVQGLTREVRQVTDPPVRRRLERQLQALRQLSRVLLKLSLSNIEKSGDVPIEKYWGDNEPEFGPTNLSAAEQRTLLAERHIVITEDGGADEQ